ncbi:tRNA (guanosine(46)-N7)-methyltransferase TrmB [Flavihumibacter petaseus]|uniref:tRNA (guanine-N(7)-)-methyltransferase n=1 Tax=Flavihumibacter petaseus NBRC 106054 TaxID=1220578 RepID=A0A0E9MXM0_9BACT|nr:tRNA (guanosine(46)-N7)-methyltransferase TrmB [Flavihumibacter petaseus]GAO42176.1 tRNA (guanine-N(7)-)-methyltransferase [Flavihumibacter petaseus NBRC 106054]
MGQNKLARFEAIKGFPNVLQYPEKMAGKWHLQFGNDHPITLELACGKGEYTVGLSAMFPDRNFIGVDVKGNRIYIGARKCLEAGQSNAAFLRTQIDRIATYFAPGEVKEIWITFPDPQLRRSRAKKRLTHPKFLRLYQPFLAPGNIIHLKTDSPVLYRFTIEVINRYGLELLEHSDDVYRQAVIEPQLKIKTHYEGLDIAGSSRIHYIRFSLPATPLPDLDAALQEWVFENEEPTGVTQSSETSGEQAL